MFDICVPKGHWTWRDWFFSRPVRHYGWEKGRAPIGRLDDLTQQLGCPALCQSCYHRYGRDMDRLWGLRPVYKVGINCDKCQGRDADNRTVLLVAEPQFRRITEPKVTPRQWMVVERRAVALMARQR